MIAISPARLISDRPPQVWLLAELGSAASSIPSQCDETASHLAANVVRFERPICAIQQVSSERWWAPQISWQTAAPSGPTRALVIPAGCLYRAIRPLHTGWPPLPASRDAKWQQRVADWMTGGRCVAAPSAGPDESRRLDGTRMRMRASLRMRVGLGLGLRIAMRVRMAAPRLERRQTGKKSAQAKQHLEQARPLQLAVPVTLPVMCACKWSPAI